VEEGVCGKIKVNLEQTSTKHKKRQEKGYRTNKPLSHLKAAKMNNKILLKT